MHTTRSGSTSDPVTIGQSSKVPSPLLSVITPTYNRSELVVRSVRSALVLTRRTSAEIVVVDDASTDDTEVRIRAAFPAELQAGLVIYERLPCNVGVSLARNHAASLARGDWLVFLDSDDTLVEGSASALIEELGSASNRPFVFFRCVDSESGALIGAEHVRGELSLSRLLTDQSWGECLPVVRRTRFLEFGYPTDIRGGEGLTYLQIAERYGPGLLTTIRARSYDTQGSDRLCSPAGMRRRGMEIARFHLYVLRRYWRQRPIMHNLRGALASLYHAARYASSLLSR